jgi:hypothetical protein
MLSTTEQLLAGLDADPPARWPSRWIEARARSILRYGSHVDAEALLPAFLSDPEGLRDLLPVLARHGDASTAARLLDRCFEHGQLRPAMPEGVLQTIGYLGYEPATVLLWRHVLDGDWYAQRDACLGLAHLSCDEVAADIQRELIRHRAKSRFPEFLPVLAVKTHDPTWPDEMLDWGTYLASTDCNGGLLLGLALHGEAGRAAFGLALWSPTWEAYSAATGTVYWAYAGALVLGLGMRELYEEMHAHLRTATDPRDRVNCVLVMTNLLHCWVDGRWPGLRKVSESSDITESDDVAGRDMTEPTESAAEVYEALFEHNDPLDHLAERIVGEAYAAGITDFGGAEQHGYGGGAEQRDDSVGAGQTGKAEPRSATDGVKRPVYDVRQRLELRVYHEAEVELFRGTKP